MTLGSHHRFMTELIRRSSTNRKSRTMSLTRVQHISISLDGFATGERQSLDAPFGHAGERLGEQAVLIAEGKPIAGSVTHLRFRVRDYGPVDAVGKCSLRINVPAAAAAAY
jgi:hypothetical protein